MQLIKNFDTLMAHLKAENSQKSRVAVVCPHDDHTLEAIEAALAEGIATFTLFGKREAMGEVASHPNIEVIEENAPDAAAALAVLAVREGRADVLMKGLINTDNYLRAILNKQQGILPPGNVLTHITAGEIPGYRKLLFFSDVAVIPSPTLEQRKAQVSYVANLCRSFGIEKPRLALIHCTEKTSPKFPVTLDYQEIIAMASEGKFGDATVDGPMDVKVACDAESGAIKGIKSAIDGDADALIFPEIESGNAFYKTISCFCHSLNAGMLVGASAPVVLPSRSDSTRSKLCSLAMACLAAKSK